MMLEISNLSIGYKCSVAASSINCRLESSMLTCLVGNNGVGKSTLLRTIAGLQKPLAGYVRYDSEDIFTINPNNLAKYISVVLTDRLFLDDLSVFDVISMGRTPYNGVFGTLSEYDLMSIDKAFNLTGIESLRMRMVNELSDGERQKVMIAKAIAQETPVILLDEPSAFLDYNSKKDLMDLLSLLAHEHGKSILLSSHDLDIVSKSADIFWIMENGSMRVSAELNF